MGNMKTLSRTGGKLFAIVFVFSFYTTVNTGSGRHSLWALATFISGETQFPQFTVVLMLDDIQIGYFDSNINKLVPSGREANKMENDITQEGVYVLKNNYFSMKRRLSGVKQRFNLSTGVHVQQRIAGCEMLENGHSAFIMFRDACDGVDADGLLYNMTQYMYSTGNPWHLQWDDIKLIYVKMRIENIYLPVCMETLKYFLQREKSVVRKVRPRLRVLEKRVRGGARVGCLATDFYPRHITLTLLRDGRPVAEQELTGGAVLPNGNGLYQVRKTMEITAQELGERHNYTCTASHLSLDNKLDISWRPELSIKHRVPVLWGCLAMAATVLILLCMSVRMWKKMKVTESVTLEQPDDVDAQVTESILN